MEEYEKKLKAYFEEEVSGREIPPFEMPDKQSRRKFAWDNILLAACALGSLVLIIQPAIYNNRIRRSYIPMSKYEAFKENFPRVIFEGSLYFKQKQGVKND